VSHRNSLLLATALSLACGPTQEPRGARPYFDLSAATSGRGHFFDFPFPSDLRIDADGTPNMEGYPANARGGLLNPLVALASSRRGFSTIPTAYFRFTEELTSRRVETVISGSPDADILLVDVDPDSPERGTLYPTVASTQPSDQAWSPGFVLAVAPYPGVVLAPNRRYAVVVTTAVRAADGRPIERSHDVERMSRGLPPAGATANEIKAHYTPLWATLDELGIDRERVAVASVFTTGDVVADLAELADRVHSSYAITLDGLEVDPVDGDDHGQYCEIRGTASVPQFQTGLPPFPEGGRFELDDAGLPIAQRYESVPFTLTVPRTDIPDAGFPLMLYLHGSGGQSTDLVDRGRIGPTEPAQPGSGPAAVIAEHGIAGFAAALPLGPERLPGAVEQEYLNFANLAAFPSTFHQGVLEQRLFVDALVQLSIPGSVAADCGLPAGIHFDETKLVASGQSMGGMYSNMIAATDPRIGAVVPTGAGGFWHWTLLNTELIEGMDEILTLLFDVEDGGLDYTHPGLALLALAWEPAEPAVFMPRIAHRPLPGHPSRAVYQPIGAGDPYFPAPIYDAAVLAYGNQLGGDEIWSSTRKSLGVVGDSETAAYPLSANRTSSDGSQFTGVAVQFADDGIMDGHYIAVQRDEVKYQYGCFFATYLLGNATVPAPAPLGTPCPQ